MSTIALATKPILAAKLRTWWTILRICIEERLVYRGDFALGTLMRFLPIVTQIFLWTAIFETTQSPAIAGYTRNEIIAYFLLSMVGRAFSSMPGLASTIAAQIRSGEIKKFLIQPVDMLSFLLLSRIAHKLVYYVVAAGPFALVFFLCRGYFPAFPPAHIFLAFLASLIMVFVLGFYLEALMGMLGFWLLEINSLLFVYMLFSFFLSGHMFPITMIPGLAGKLVLMTPLPYLAYFPAAVYLGKIQGADLAWGLGMELVWVVVLWAACRWAFHRGLVRYSGYGG